MKPLRTRKKRVVVVEAALHQVVEAVGGQRRPLSLDGDDERALTRVEASPKLVWRRAR